MKLNNTLLLVFFFISLLGKCCNNIASRRDIYYFRGDRGGEEMRNFLHEHQLLIFDGIVCESSILSRCDGLDGNFDIF